MGLGPNEPAGQRPEDEKEPSGPLNPPTGQPGDPPLPPDPGATPPSGRHDAPPPIPELHSHRPLAPDQPPPLPPQYHQPPLGYPPQRAPRPEGVPGQVMVDGQVWEPAGCVPRLGAFLIDAVILSLLGQIMIYIIDIPQPDPDELMKVLQKLLVAISAMKTPSESLMDQYNAMMQPMLLATYLNIAMCAAYFTVFHGLIAGTFGKLCFGLRVMRRDGRPLSIGWALLRYACYLLVSKLAYTAWLVPFNAERRTLYDMVLGTNVFKVRKQG